MIARFWTQKGFFQCFVLGFGSFLTLRLITVSYPASSDLEVYWYAARAFLDGNDPYAQYSFAWPGSVFKYPPWILPLFLPLGFLSLSHAKIVWLSIEILSILTCIQWVKRHSKIKAVATWVGFLFWWIWLSHTYFGQVWLPILALALTTGPHAFPLLSYLFSVKLFSEVSLLGALPKTKTPWIQSILLFTFSHLVLMPSHVPLSTLYSSFFQAAASGGSSLGDVVRGPQNHGFPALILKFCNVDQHFAHVDAILSLFLGACLALLWRSWVKKCKLGLIESWVGWIALGVVIHPLAWHHSFVMTYPLCALSLDRAIASKRRPWIVLSVFGIALIALIIPQVIGVEGARIFELFSSKSWGVLICGVILGLANPQRKLTLNRL